MFEDRTDPSQKEKKQSQETLDRDLCVICFEEPINTVFLECGHVVACRKCSDKLKQCPLCRRWISRVVNIYRAT